MFSQPGGQWANTGAGAGPAAPPGAFKTTTKRRTKRGKNEEAMSRIAIIGAGLSGRLLALNLLRFASSDAAVSIRMLDRGDERNMGPACSCDVHSLAVNRPAR